MTVNIVMARCEKVERIHVHLRCHRDAQIEIKEESRNIRVILSNSIHYQYAYYLFIVHDLCI